MPLEEMAAAAADRAALQQELALGEAQEGPALQQQDYLVMELLAWFKTRFFSWVRNSRASRGSRGGGLLLLRCCQPGRLAHSPGRQGRPGPGLAWPGRLALPSSWTRPL
jgi:hypothetical protein